MIINMIIIVYVWGERCIEQPWTESLRYGDVSIVSCLQFHFISIRFGLEFRLHGSTMTLAIV